jgi:hypothetical protein
MGDVLGISWVTVRKGRKKVRSFCCVHGFSANRSNNGVDPRGLELLASAMRGRHEGLQEFSGACKMPANGSILMRILFSAFQEIYSGCCTVAAHDQKDARGEWRPFSESLRGELRCVARTLPSSDAAPISRIMFM